MMELVKCGHCDKSNSRLLPLIKLDTIDGLQFSLRWKCSYCNYEVNLETEENDNSRNRSSS